MTGQDTAERGEENRLDRLERRCRWLERVVCILLVGVGVSLFMNQRQATFVRSLTPQGPVPTPTDKPFVVASTVRAAQIELVDGSGQVLGEWGPNAGDEGGVAFCFGGLNGGRQVRLVVGKDGQPGLQLVGRGGYRRIDLDMGGGRPAVRVQDGKEGGEMFRASPGAAGPR